MEFFITHIKAFCTKCSGYGTYDEHSHKLTHCPSCYSIHPEALGLTYAKADLNFYIYLKTTPGFWPRLKRGSLNDKAHEHVSEARH